MSVADMVGRYPNLQARSATPTETPPYFEIYGPIAIGTIVNAFGFGIFSLQALTYFAQHPKASWRLKLLVLLVLLLNVGQTMAECTRSVKIIAVHAGDAGYLLDMHKRPEELASLILTVVISTVAQLFLFRRCLQFADVTANPVLRGSFLHRLRYWGLVFFLGGGIAASFGTGIGADIAFWQLPSLLETVPGTEGSHKFLLLTHIWLGTSSAVDVCLCCIILWQLRNAVRGLQDPSKIVSYLGRVIFQSGVAVTALQIVALVAYVKTTSAWSDFPAIFISKVYSITLVASLSNPYRSRASAPACTGHPIPPMAMAMPPPSGLEEGQNWTLDYTDNRPTQASSGRLQRITFASQPLAVTYGHGQGQADTVGVGAVAVEQLLGRDSNTLVNISNASGDSEAKHHQSLSEFLIADYEQEKVREKEMERVGQYDLAEMV